MKGGDRQQCVGCQRMRFPDSRNEALVGRIERLDLEQIEDRVPPHKRIRDTECGLGSSLSILVGKIVLRLSAVVQPQDAVRQLPPEPAIRRRSMGPIAVPQNPPFTHDQAERQLPRTANRRFRPKGAI